MSAIAEPMPADDDDQRRAAQWRPLILGVLLLALIARLTAAIVVERHVQHAGRSFLVEGDANGYWDLGKSLAAGEEYSIHQPPRRVLRVPGFPLLLAASIRLFGEDIFAARCVLAVAGTGCCWLTWCLGSRLVMRRVGFWAALLMAIHPLQIINSVLILSENWFTFWMLASLLMLVKLVDGPRGLPDEPQRLSAGLLARAILTGGFIAAAVLIRPGFLPWLGVALLLVVLLQRPPVPTRLLAAGALVAAFGVVMLPWVVRNQQVTGHWVLTSLWSGPSLYDGLNPEADGGSNMEFFDRDNVMSSMSEYEMNRHYQQLAWQFARENPDRAVSLAGRKLARFLQPVPAGAQAGWVVWVVCGAVAVVFMLLCLAGLRSGLMDPVGCAVTIGPFLLFMGVHMVFVGSLRYRLPAEFPLAILAAVGLRQWLPGRRVSGDGAAAAEPSEER